MKPLYKLVRGERPFIHIADEHSKITQNNILQTRNNNY